ncbi:hypothetical protein BT69DRAFT_1330896 [Atractiella rhizophila]|nr:hypothetical protein BT69DRAFT_1330896 [Atractiella rhizophila]
MPPQHVVQTMRASPLLAKRSYHAMEGAPMPTVNPKELPTPIPMFDPCHWTSAAMHGPSPASTATILTPHANPSLLHTTPPEVSSDSSTPASSLSNGPSPHNPLACAIPSVSPPGAFPSMTVEQISQLRKRKMGEMQDVGTLNDNGIKKSRLGMNT